MHAYFSLTCHFISEEWKIVSYLFACKQMFSCHTGERIFLEFEEIIDKFKTRSTVYKAVTDNASNLKRPSLMI